MTKTRMRTANIVLQPDHVARCQEWGRPAGLSASQVIRIAIERILLLPKLTPMEEQLGDQSQAVHQSQV